MKDHEYNVRNVPSQEPRVGCGPVAFGDDWPGTFIRGDTAAYYAGMLRSALSQDGSLGAFERIALVGLYDVLRSCVVGPARSLFPDVPLQQSSSGITAGAEKPAQVVDFGAAAQNRTADLLITNQDKNTPETSNNQDVTPKTAPAQPAQVAPTESSGCEGVTAALDVIRFALQDASRLVVCADETHPKLCGLARGSLLKAHDAWHVIAAQWADRDPNARWLTLAHNLCADAGVPSGHIADRLEGLRAVLESHA